MCGDRNIGWPCETCSTVLLFVPSAGASTDIWSGLRPLVRSFIVPLAHSCSLMWKNMNTSAPVAAAVGVLPSHISFVFHNVSCIPSGVGIRNSSCLILFVTANIRAYFLDFSGSKARWNYFAPRRIAGNKGEVEGAAGNSHGCRDARALRRIPQTSRYSRYSYKAFKELPRESKESGKTWWHRVAESLVQLQPLQVAQIEAQKRLERELLRWRLRH